MAATLLTEDSYIRMCGEVCTLLPELSDVQTTVCELPGIVTSHAYNYFNVQPQLLEGTITPPEAASLYDGDVTSTYETEDGCSFSMTFDGEAILDEVRLYVRRWFDYSTNSVSDVDSVVFEGSNDGFRSADLIATFTDLAEGWNKFSTERGEQPVYSSFRLTGNRVGSCPITEIKLMGGEVINDSADAHSCTPQLVILGESTDITLEPVTFKTERTPVIAGISPRFGDALTSNLVTITGSNLGQSTVRLAGKECDI